MEAGCNIFPGMLLSVPPGSNLPHLHKAQSKAAKYAPKPFLPLWHFAQSLREALVPRQKLGPDAVPHEGAGRVPEVDSRVDHQESIPAQHRLPALWAPVTTPAQPNRVAVRYDCSRLGMGWQQAVFHCFLGCRTTWLDICQREARSHHPSP